MSQAQASKQASKKKTAHKTLPTLSTAQLPAQASHTNATSGIRAEIAAAGAEMTTLLQKVVAARAELMQGRAIARPSHPQVTAAGRAALKRAVPGAEWVTFDGRKWEVAVGEEVEIQRREDRPSSCPLCCSIPTSKCELEQKLLKSMLSRCCCP